MSEKQNESPQTEESPADSSPENSECPVQEETKSEDEDFNLALLTPEERQIRREKSKPDISWLREAVVDGKFLPGKGAYVIIERKNILSTAREWLDTKVYRLLAEPSSNGDLKLVDCVDSQCARMNWITALEHGFSLKLPPPGKNPETLLESGGKRRVKKRLERLSGKMKVSRRQKNSSR